MKVFKSADIMIPKNVDNTKWSVVACDQFTSQPEYWQDAEKIVGDSPSTLNLVYPEAFLSEGDARIDKINASMKKYAEDGIFETLPDSLLYIERTLEGGKVRPGIIGAIDLEAYDFTKGSKSPVRATEGTVLERIPPRVKIRENASLEFPHAILLIDDIENKVFDTIKKGKCVYDFELMKKGGHLTGYVIDNKDEILDILHNHEASAVDNLAYAVGDGNHSIATAKTCWENLKATLSDAEKETHPARFCLVELENIHDKSLEFEPIHRCVFGCDPEKLVSDFISATDASSEDNGGQHIKYVYKNKSGDLYIKNSSSPLEVGTLQNFLDTCEFEVDYIHGEDVVESLSQKDGVCGFILPSPNKSDLFVSVIKDGALPRKTFSMGEAHEKRYYMEGKKIKR